MNERQLHSFIVAADTKSFSKAAATSFISTPALVQQINLLEANIGFKLFIRTNQGISLTPSGELFYKSAKKILDLFDSACAQGRELEKMEQLTLRIATPLEKVPNFVLEAYEAFYKDFPNASIEFISIPFSEHISAISAEIVDLSIIAEPAGEFMNNLTFFPLYEDTYSFCMRPDHPLANLKLITPPDLKKAKIISGKYNYLNIPFSKNLPQFAKVQPLDKEYDLSIAARRLVSDEIMVIHSLWKNNYESMIKVVPSNISAGKIGVLYRSSNFKAIESFLPYLKKSCSNDIES